MLAEDLIIAYKYLQAGEFQEEIEAKGQMEYKLIINKVRQGIRRSPRGRRLMQISRLLGAVGTDHITTFKRGFDKCMTGVI